MHGRSIDPVRVVAGRCGLDRLMSLDVCDSTYPDSRLLNCFQPPFAQRACGLLRDESPRDSQLIAVTCRAILASAGNNQIGRPHPKIESNAPSGDRPPRKHFVADCRTPTITLVQADFGVEPRGDT
jgi:hypothetical protein